jgi:uncharacterized protein
MIKSRGDRFVWYELLTTDVKAAKAFYADVVGWKTRDIPLPGVAYSLFDAADGAVAGLMHMPESVTRAGAVSHWMGYVGVADLDAALARVIELGGTIRVPPVSVSNVSRFSIVADPQDATFALVQGMKPSQDLVAELGTSGHVGWHELFAADWENAFPFYGELLGWRKTLADAGPTGTYQQFAVGGHTIGGMADRPGTLPLSFWLHYFNVPDIEVASKRVEQGGGVIFFGPVAVPGGPWIVHCKDPQGAMFGLLDRRSRKVLEAYVASLKSGAKTP